MPGSLGSAQPDKVTKWTVINGDEQVKLEATITDSGTDNAHHLVLRFQHASIFVVCHDSL